MAACVERRAACGASYNACASGATPCKFETRQPARPAGKVTADRQFQRRVRRRLLAAWRTWLIFSCVIPPSDESSHPELPPRHAALSSFVNRSFSTPTIVTDSVGRHYCTGSISPAFAMHKYRLHGWIIDHRQHLLYDRRRWREPVAQRVLFEGELETSRCPLFVFKR